jgi:flagellin
MVRRPDRQDGGGRSSVSMALTVTTNTTANTAIRHLRQNDASAANSLAKLSSGSRIVKSSDDVAGLAVGTKLKADVTALRAAQVNASHAQSLLQVADGGLARISDILIRMKALASQAISGSVSDSERAFIDQEYQALRTQIDSTANQTKFNGQALLNGATGKSIATVGAGVTNAGISVSLSGNAQAGSWTLAYDGTDTFTLTGPAPDNLAYSVEIDPGTALVYEGTIDFAAAGVSINLSNFDPATAVSAANTFTVTGTGSIDFQVGVAVADTVTVNLADVSAGGLGLTGDSVTTAANAANASTLVDAAISGLNSARADTGALMSRFEFVSANLSTQVENLDAARSTLMDVDVAEEMARFSSANVLQQAATAMLAQANQLPQNLLRLLQG